MNLEISTIVVLLSGLPVLGLYLYARWERNKCRRSKEK